MYYCNSCARATGMLPARSTGPFIATSYQRGKWGKHLTPATRFPEQGIFATTSTSVYGDWIVGALNFGFVEIDSDSRTNIILATTQHTGFRYESGLFIHDTDSIKVALSSSPTLIHAFPVNSSSYSTASCIGCRDAVIP